MRPQNCSFIKTGQSHTQINGYSSNHRPNQTVPGIKASSDSFLATNQPHLSSSSSLSHASTTTSDTIPPLRLLPEKPSPPSQSNSVQKSQSSPLAESSFFNQRYQNVQQFPNYKNNRKKPAFEKRLRRCGLEHDGETAVKNIRKFLQPYIQRDINEVLEKYIDTYFMKAFTNIRENINLTSDSWSQTLKCSISKSLYESYCEAAQIGPFEAATLKVSDLPYFPNPRMVSKQPAQGHSDPLLSTFKRSRQPSLVLNGDLARSATPTDDGDSEHSHVSVNSYHQKVNLSDIDQNRPSTSQLAESSTPNGYQRGQSTLRKRNSVQSIPQEMPSRSNCVPVQTQKRIKLMTEENSSFSKIEDLLNQDINNQPMNFHNHSEANPPRTARFTIGNHLMFSKFPSTPNTMMTANRAPFSETRCFDIKTSHSFTEATPNHISSSQSQHHIICNPHQQQLRPSVAPPSAPSSSAYLLSHSHPPHLHHGNTHPN